MLARSGIAGLFICLSAWTASFAEEPEKNVDTAKLMRDYLTGAIPPPDDFSKVMGYAPVHVETADGTRMHDPFGAVSAPKKLGPTKEFDPMAKTHDYGYDLLRYYARKGKPLPPTARKAADALFREDMLRFAEKHEGEERTQYVRWALTYSLAVELNSRRQKFGPP